jgi:D-alanyl-D-alanine carboxypeptidase/D-alanyl-D-alanine-endopeptidase (penicillin-binding protein 4)
MRRSALPAVSILPRALRRGSLCATWLVLCLAAVLPAQRALRSRAPRGVETLVAAAEAAGLRVGIAARELDGATVLAAHRAHEGFAPASNQKLLTAAAALATLGVEHRFITRFALREGELVVVAGGDPNWLSGTEYDPKRVLHGIAKQLRDAGVGAVRGIRVEAGSFVGPGRPASWPRDQLHLDYCAPSSGLLLEGSTWTIELAADGDGVAARLVAPWTGYRISGALRATADRREGGRYHVRERDAVLELDGAFWTKGSARQVRGSSADPTGVVVRALQAALADHGILVHPDAPTPSRELTPVATPLLPALERALRESSNIDAEQILRALGAARGDASFPGSLAALREALPGLVDGALPDALVLVDGSGLSRDNRCTPQFLVDVLAAVAARADGARFIAALPRAGQDGTLERRFKGSGLEGRVRAKTGTINGASTLSGYLARSGDRIVAFSILCDTQRAGRGAPDPRQLQEQLVQALDGDGR